MMKVLETPSAVVGSLTTARGLLLHSGLGAALGLNKTCNPTRRPETGPPTHPEAARLKTLESRTPAETPD